MPKLKPKLESNISSLAFFAKLKWLDGKPLLDSIEPYRRRLFEQALDSIGPDGLPTYNMILVGRAKKNYKSSDLDLAALFKLIVPESIQGNDCLVCANDEDQARTDLDLCKKLIAVNPVLQKEVEVLVKEIKRKDGRGTLRVLPAQNVVGQHGRSAIFLGFDEIHGFKNWDLFEALAPDPTRRDVLTWITSYDTIFNQAGVPLYDLKQIGKAGTDPRLLFQWYAGDFSTDQDFADKSPEERANPSMSSWAEGAKYLEQQRRRLPSNKYRRLHLNLPGSPSGAFLDQNKILAAVAVGVRKRQFESGTRYYAFVDMSGGSNDNACLAIAHRDKDGNAVLDLVEKQAGGVPFDPRAAIKKFVHILDEYGINEVHGDNYAGTTFPRDFEDHYKRYRVTAFKSASDIYERFEPRLNAGEILLVDDATLIEELSTLILKPSGKVTHESGSHDDHANACCGACLLALGQTNRPRYAFCGAGMNGNPDSPLYVTG
jgi:phage terminase large subunit-like protein